MSAFNIAVSGLQAESRRLAISADNVANLRSRGVDPDAVAPDPAAFVPKRASAVSVASGGVRVEAVAVSPPSVPSFEPNDPAANAEGIVYRPNVSLEQEVVTQIQASRSYQANLQVIKTQDRMLGALFDIFS